MLRYGCLALLAGLAAGGASLAACSGSQDNPSGDDGGSAEGGGKDAAGGDSGGKDSGGKDATSDAHDGSTMDAADGSGDDATEGGDDASDGSTGDADATDGGGDDASGDAADASDASSWDSSSVYGNVFFENVPNFNVGVVSATFYSSPQPLFVGCTTTAYGACTHYDCPNQPDAGAPVGAGTLTATGGALGNGGVMITQGMGGSYQYQSMSSLMSQGDTMGISASGGTIPAFGPVDVVATGMITVTAPMPNGMVYTINTAQDLSLTWTGGEANALALFEVSATFGASNRGAVCFFDATLGSGSLPAAAMSNLTGGSNTQFVYGQWRETDFTAGAYPLRSVAIQLGEGTASLQ